MSKPCTFRKLNGNQCRAIAMTGYDYCYFHAPDKQPDRIKAAQRGGKANGKNTSVMPYREINSPQDVMHLLGETINSIRSGELELKVGTQIGYLSNIWLNAYEVSVLEQRVSAMAEVLAQKGLLT